MVRPPPPPAVRRVAISPDDGSAIDLANPALAAALSWLIPGLGQLYQGRTFKGVIFLIPLVCTFLAGMWIGGGNVVYASWRPGEKRWAFLGQAGIGAAAIPAMIQSSAVGGSARQPLANLPWLVPPLARGQEVSEAFAQRLVATDPDVSAEDFRRQPGGRARYEPRHSGGQLSLWHRRLGRFFDIGTLYTMLAGLLNLLVIYDAWAGPMRPLRPDGEDGGHDEKAPQPPRGAGR
ncbi:MAG: DUF6677 family protein [Planctomycetota bacterium]